MHTAESIIDWITSLNPWQLTFWITVGASAWFAAFDFCARLLQGGYAGDDSDDDTEDAK